MSVELSIPLKSLEQPLGESIRELRRGYQAVSDCLEQTMAECDLRGTELADCRRQLAEARRSLSECEKQLAERTRADGDLTHRYSALKKQFEQKHGDLVQANDRASQAQSEGAQNKQRLEMQIEQNQQLRQQAERYESEAEATRNELTQLRTQFAALAESAAEGVKLRGELAEANCSSRVCQRKQRPIITTSHLPNNWPPSGRSGINWKANWMCCVIAGPNCPRP